MWCRRKESKRKGKGVVGVSCLVSGGDFKGFGCLLLKVVGDIDGKVDIVVKLGRLVFLE